MKENKEDVPPNSRVFVLHCKNTTKEELQEAFDKFGKVEDIWMVRDRESGELKGVTYVKFSKMSEAALAVEQMNGVALESNPRPLKVIIANSRDQGSRKDDDISRFLRLFIVVPKDDSETEESLKDYFQKFGEVEYVNILRNRDTNESKGFAYVKYNKIYHAAKALEECNAQYKAVLARPKEKRNEPASFNKPMKDYKYNAAPTSSHYGDLCDGYSSDQGYTRLCAFISTQLTEDLAIRLFDLIPGLAFARMTDDVISHRTQKMILEYETPEAASFAVDRLNGFEYPVGEPIMVKPDFSGWKSGPQPLLNPKSMYNGRKRDYTGTPNRSGHDNNPEVSKKIANLTEALEEATSIIKAAGLTTGSVAKYCTAKLPPAQPIVKGEEGKYRLFIVCQPEAPPIQALKDVFSRFGNLVDVYLLPGKNYGYASFCNEESANQAITIMHGEELYGNRLKVMEAEPRVEGKRPRYE